MIVILVSLHSTSGGPLMDERINVYRKRDHICSLGFFFSPFIYRSIKIPKHCFQYLEVKDSEIVSIFEMPKLRLSGEVIVIAHRSCYNCTATGTVPNMHMWEPSCSENPLTWVLATDVT